MNRERWQRVEAIFHAALEQSDQDRATFVNQACDGDTSLRDEVAALLAYDDPYTSFIERPALEALGSDRVNGAAPVKVNDTAEATLLSDTPPDGPRDETELLAGHQLQNYRIIRKLGAGGMGEVYLAEDVRLGRQVALKLLPPSIHADGKAGKRFLREARAASALNHPNIVTIYKAEEADGVSFIEMEFVDGESLRDRLLRGPLELQDVIALGLQAADAASAAHAINIVHRDLKPGNILFTQSEQVKIVDFGLAKIAGATAAAPCDPAAVAAGAISLTSVSLSQAGSVSGTVPYMSPEQTRGEHIDARSDIFSLGCVLYEAATGRRPFEGTVPVEIIQKIRDVNPPRPSAVRSGLPRAFDAVILRALAKDKEQRYRSAEDLAAALRRLQTRESFVRNLKRLRVPAAVVAIIAIAYFAWDAHTTRQRQEEAHRQALARAIEDSARRRVPEVQQLFEQRRYFEAYDLAQQLMHVIPGDKQLAQSLPRVTDVLNVTSEPPGAIVMLQRYQPDGKGSFPDPVQIGTTPIEQASIARGDYLLRIEKDGYVTLERTISSEFGRWENGFWHDGALQYVKPPEAESDYDWITDSEAPINLNVVLSPAGTVPDGMVRVAGGPYNLVAWGRPSENTAAQLDEFFMDTCEVTNGAFAEFVQSGGYRNRELWKHTFVRDGQEVSWEEAMQILSDPQRNGPASWPEGRAPAGRERHPVTNVSWYEAAAYALFRGKQLPTVYQWEHAARGPVIPDDKDGRSTVLAGPVMPWGLTNLGEDLQNRANLSSRRGTTPVGSYPFGRSPYGCCDMAGNVWEWCLNPRPEGFTTAGGSYHEGPNLFGSYGDFPGFYCSETLGFRCALNMPDATGDQGGMLLPHKDDVPEFTPLPEDAFRLIRTFYEYDQRPPEAEIIEQVETPAWKRLKIRYVCALRQRSAEPIPRSKWALAYLWLPGNSRPPFQVVNYKPGGASYQGLLVPQEAEVVCKPFLDSGRAVFVAVIEGMRERDLPPDWTDPEIESVAYRDMVVTDTLDQRIGLDYLAARGDIDMDRIACMGLSQGGFDLITMAVEERFQACLLLSAGLGRTKRKIIDAGDPVNFAPYISGPKMMIHGRYDEAIPFETRARPLFALLSEPKEMVVLECGHFPPMKDWVPPALRFLDETLGPVETTDGPSEIAQQER